MLRSNNPQRVLIQRVMWKNMEPVLNAPFRIFDKKSAFSYPFNTSLVSLNVKRCISSFVHTFLTLGFIVSISGCSREAQLHAHWEA
jgi:hypothetical protein